MMDEIWKIIPDTIGHYLVSSHGRIKSIRSNKIMRPLRTTTGYHQIQLRINGITIQRRIHRIVAQCFLENPENKPEVNHKDGNRVNNCLSNLEWCTKSENSKHAYDSGLNPNIKPVLCLDRNGSVLKKYRSARDAEKDGYLNQLIAKCCLGHRKYHKGKSWKYA